MSRSISIWYIDKDGIDRNIETKNFDLLGTQSASKLFWSIPLLTNLGISRLTELSVTDPVCFDDWPEIDILRAELAILEANIDLIDFDNVLKQRWLYNLDSTNKCNFPRGLEEGVSHR